MHPCLGLMKACLMFLFRPDAPFLRASGLLKVRPGHCLMNLFVASKLLPDSKVAPCFMVIWRGSVAEVMRSMPSLLTLPFNDSRCSV